MIAPNNVKESELSALQSKSAVITKDRNTTNKSNKCKKGKGGTPRKMEVRDWIGKLKWKTIGELGVRVHPVYWMVMN